MSGIDADQSPAPTGSIVVGHDGSDYANHALAVALDLAEPLGASVVVVRAWSIDTAPRPADWKFGYVSPLTDYAGAVREKLEADARPTAAQHPAVPVEYRAAYATPLSCLINVSREARMLVVGSRGRGGLAGMLLGSVSEQCVRHAACPVLVVRPGAPA